MKLTGKFATRIAALSAVLLGLSACMPPGGEGGGEGGLGGGMMTILPLVLIFAVFYFLIIRPQQRKSKTHKAMLQSVRRGDQVVTGGGIIGNVTKIDRDDNLHVEIAPGVRVKVTRTSVTDVITRPTRSATRTTTRITMTRRTRPRTRRRPRPPKRTTSRVSAKSDEAELRGFGEPAKPGRCRPVRFVS